MRLYLVRHGLAVDRLDPKCPTDSKRSLTPEGVKKTRGAMRGLKVMGVKPEAMLTSPYLRAVETAEIAADELGFPADKIHSTDSLKPGATPSELFKELAKLRADEVMCFGHAPHLDLAIGYALGGRTSVTELKKAGVACLELGKVTAGGGLLIWLMAPKTLRDLGDSG